MMYDVAVMWSVLHQHTNVNRLGRVVWDLIDTQDVCVCVCVYVCVRVRVYVLVTKWFSVVSPLLL